MVQYVQWSIVIPNVPLSWSILELHSAWVPRRAPPPCATLCLYTMRQIPRAERKNLARWITRIGCIQSFQSTLRQTGSVTIGCPMKFVESGAIWPVKRPSLPPRSCKSVEALVAPILCVDPHAPHAPLSRCVHFGDLPHHLGLEKPRRPARPRSPVITRLQRQKCIHDLQTHNGSQW